MVCLKNRRINMLRLTSSSRFESIIFHSSDDPYRFKNPRFFLILEISTVNPRKHVCFSIANDRKLFSYRYKLCQLLNINQLLNIKSLSELKSFTSFRHETSSTTESVLNPVVIARSYETEIVTSVSVFFNLSQHG